MIDGTKLISAGLLYDGDAWDLVLAGCPVTQTVPLSTVLTFARYRFGDEQRSSDFTS